jgi:septal ring factor EnvC (AmiA/AmiB activator)
LKSRISKLELENTDLKKRIRHTEDKLSTIERMIQDLKKGLPET